MRNLKTSLSIGGALVAAAILAACGGGGTSSPTAVVPAAGSPGTASQATGTHITVHFRRGSGAHAHMHAQAAKNKRRRPTYISYGAEGLQIAITSGSTTQTVYADVSSSSPLCVNGNGSPDTYTTCTIAVPTVGTSETIVGTVIDQAPTGEVNGYGTAFPSTANVLGVGNLSATITGSVNNLTLGINPVFAQLFTCDQFTPSSANFYADGDGRIVVTSGVASTSTMGFYGEDASGWESDFDPTPMPFVDVNGSPSPVTVTSSSSHLLVGGPIPSPLPGTLPAATSQTVSIPDDSSQWYNCLGFAVSLAIDNTTPDGATLTVKNNLSAASTFGGQTYSSTIVYTVDALSVSPNAATAAVGTDTRAHIDGHDYLGNSGSLLEPAGDCMDTTNSSQTDATVTTYTAMNTTTWLQTFQAIPLVAGTCTFTLEDSRTGVISPPVTLTVNP